MPTYEYRCEECNHDFEAFQSITEPALSTCPACGGRRVKRLISAGAGFIFKGSGFYITDYKNKSADSGKPAGKKTEPPKPRTQDKKTKQESDE